MRVVAVLVAVACFSLSVEAQNVICGAKTTSKTVTVEDGNTFSFKTQKGKKYKGNTKCTVDYKMGDTCSKMSFVCTKFNTNNKDKKKCSKGDKVTVTANGKPKAYCKTKKPKVVSTGDMSVVFTSDKKKHGPGAVCKVKCTEAASGGTAATTWSPSNCRCGEKLSRVIGGSEAPVNGYPWMAMLADRPGGDQFCGGAVINSRWIATAAHCVSTNGGTPATYTVKPSSIWVVLGEHTHTTASETNMTRKFRVEKIVVHKNGKGKASIVDLALLKVTEEIPLTLYTPLCLPDAGYDIRGQNVTLTGWGLLNCPSPNTNPWCTGGVPAPTLQEITFPVPSLSVCSAATNNHGKGKVFCWGGEKGKSGCFGDSGSPLIYNQDGQFTLMGSVSGGSGSGCGARDTYGMAWEVAKYRDWYQEVATGANWCLE